MHYTIRHVTRFTYETPIAESMMEARMQPRSDATQRCIRFGLSTTPASRVMMYQDHDGNIVHHFNIPGRHTRLVVTADTANHFVVSLQRPDWHVRFDMDKEQAARTREMLLASRLSAIRAAALTALRHPPRCRAGARSTAPTPSRRARRQSDCPRRPRPRDEN